MVENGGKIVLASSGRKTTIHGSRRTIRAGKRQIVFRCHVRFMCFLGEWGLVPGHANE